MSTPDIVPPEAEAHLDWIALTDRIAEGHMLPKAEVEDTFLYRDPDTLLSRAAWIDGLGALVKTATVFPGNPGRGSPMINGAAALYSDKDGTLAALVDFHLLTKWKTAGDSLLAARHLAPAHAKRLLICGAGVVAGSLVQAYRAAFPGIDVAIWNRTPDRAAALADRVGARHAVDLAHEATQADIISSATMATAPFLRGEWLRPGQHIDLIGAYRPDMREADNTALTRARIFVDSRATTLDHIGELKIPLANGTIQREDICADYYDLSEFTRAPQDITLFKNGGGAHLDLMTASYILDRWRRAR